MRRGHALFPLEGQEHIRVSQSPAPGDRCRRQGKHKPCGGPLLVKLSRAAMKISNCPEPYPQMAAYRFSRLSSSRSARPIAETPFPPGVRRFAWPNE
jgi:hypothetical protein